MSLNPRINVAFGGSSLVVYDTTCSFDSGYNEGGYNVANASPVDAASATIDITAPGEVTPITIDVYPSLPNATGIGFEITLADLAPLASIGYGEWIFKYTITFNDGTVFTKQCYFLNTIPVQCCIDGKMNAIDPICEPDKFAKLADLQTMLQSAVSAHCVGKYTKAQEILNYVNEQCNCCC